MALDGRITAKATLAAYCDDVYEAARQKVKKEQRRHYPQNEFAVDHGIDPQMFSRVKNGATNIMADSAIDLLVGLGPDVIQHLDFSRSSIDEDTAYIIATLPRLDPRARKEVVNSINKKKLTDEAQGPDVKALPA